MGRTVKVDIEETYEMLVRFPARSWENAHDVIEKLKETPPDGYRLVESMVKPRSEHKSGRRCNVSMTFIYIDDRVVPYTTGGAKAYFEPFMLEAQGVNQ
jgi:hypothetical protein